MYPFEGNILAFPTYTSRLAEKYKLHRQNMTSSFNISFWCAVYMNTKLNFHGRNTDLHRQYMNIFHIFCTSRRGRYIYPVFDVLFLVLIMKSSSVCNNMLKVFISDEKLKKMILYRLFNL